MALPPPVMRAGRWGLIVGLGLVYAFFVRRASADGRVVVSTLAQAAAAGWAGVACLVAHRRSGRADHRWTLIAAGAWTFGLAQSIVAVDDLILGGPHDLVIFVFLPSIPLCVTGLLRFIQSPTSRPARVASLVESFMIAVAVLTVAWSFVLGPVYADSTGGVARVMSLVFPMGDVLIAAVVLIVASQCASGTRRQLTYLAGGVLLFVVGDGAFAVLTLHGAYRTGTWPDVLWVVGWVVVGFACLAAAPAASARALGEGVVARWTHVVVLAPVAVALALAIGRLMDDPDDTPLWMLLALLTAAMVAQAASSAWARYQLTAYLEDEVAARTVDLARRERYFRSLVAQSSEVVLVLDRDLRVSYLTPSLRRTFGYDAEGFIGHDGTDLVLAEDVPALLEALDRAKAAPGVPVPAAGRVRHVDGTVRSMEVAIVSLLDDPDVEAVVVNVRDVTQREALQRKLAHQAFHDELTGLPNRTLFRQRVDGALADGHASRSVAVLFVDLDGFKDVNDALGHSAGDALLTTVAHRVRELVDVRHTVARLGGDEFALLLDGADVASASALGEEVLVALQSPFLIEGRELLITASIGVATTDTCASAADLLRAADMAMYQAKAGGRSRVEVFTPAMHDEALARLELEADLSRAVARDELRLEYQPLVGLATGRVVGAEALVRWRHPRLGLVPPAAFIPLAEESGAIVGIGSWVLREAARQARAWRRRLGDDAPPISVNVSARQLVDEGFIEDAVETVLSVGARPEWLVLELTESILVSVDVDPVARLTRLRDAGFRLAIDDFGTGYSNLSYLHRLPVSELKIDRSFVQALTEGESEVALVRMIIELGRALSLPVVAEGVETLEQRQLLLDLGCRLGQGYLFARPGDPEVILALVTAGGVGRPVSTGVDRASG